MSLENLPGGEQNHSHVDKVDEHWNKVKISGVLGIAFAAGGIIFAPSLAGAAVMSGEMVRQLILEAVEANKVANKFK